MELWPEDRHLALPTSRGLLRYTPVMKASGRHHTDIPLPHSRFLVSLIEELIHLSGTLTFATAAQGTLLNHLVLMACGTYT